MGYSVKMLRQLRLFDILCLGVNAIVGSGIFLIPGRLSGAIGPGSIFLFLLCGLMLMTVALCFAEASSRIDRNGGPYNYARAAFGDTLGFGVGWIAFVTAIFSYATVVSGLPGFIASFLPGSETEGLKAVLGYGWGRHVFTAALIGSLALLNIRGVRLGAMATNIFTVGKLIPLAIFAVLGLGAIDLSHVTPVFPHGFAPISGVLLAVVFTYQGFEVAPVPAGETVNAKTVVPRAMILSLGISAILYMWIQLVVVGSGANLSKSEAALADAAQALFGNSGALLISVGGVISMMGYAAGMAFSAPRYLTVLCEDGFLPATGAKQHARYQTPYVAIVFYSITTYLMTLKLDFNNLVDISAIAVVLQYAFTCLAVPFLRRKFPDQADTYRIPGGWAFPVLGLVMCALFVLPTSEKEFWDKFWQFLWSGVAILIGLAVAQVYKFLRPATVQAR